MAHELPHDIQAERAVLGTAMKAPDLMKEVMVELPDKMCFHDIKHKLIYEAMLVLTRHQEQCEIVAVSIELSRRGDLKRVGGRNYLVGMVEDIASTANIMSWVRTVREKYQLRSIIGICQEATSSAMSGDLDAEELVGNITPTLVQTTAQVSSKGFRLVSSLVPDVFSRLEAIQKGHLTYGVQSGFRSFDGFTGGFGNGDLIILGGRPRWGKTAFLMNVAENCLIAGHSVGMVSAETNCPEFVTRALCTTAEIDSLEVRTGKISDRDWTKLVKASATLGGWDYYIDDTPEIEINTLCGRAAQLKQESNISILFVDYLTKITTTHKFDSKRLAIDYIVSQLKTLAMTLNIPVVVAAQLNRMIETRGGHSWRAKTPTLGDFKETGRIEEDADLVLALFRPDLYIAANKKDYTRYENTAKLLGLKQRKGPNFEVSLKFIPEFTRFEEMMYAPELMPF